MASSAGSVDWTTVKVLITTRTYPTPAAKGVEVSCTAGITDDGRWIRLFPVPYRFLDRDSRFRKYQWIEVAVKKAGDSRKESYNLNLESIKILEPPLSTKNRWRARTDVIFPLRTPSLCALMSDDRQFELRDSLGVFRPKTITRLSIKPDAADWTPEELGRLRQGSLFHKSPAKELEKIPFKFKYKFTCESEGCRGHELSCSDWEMGQSYRSWRVQYGSDWQTKFRQRYESDMINRFDTHFHVGTVRAHPKNWMIVGLIYPPPPPKAEQIELFPRP